jgi:hypothetical protein
MEEDEDDDDEEIMLQRQIQHSQLLQEQRLLT